MSINIQDVRRRKAELLQPNPLSTLRELEEIVEPKPHYVGPGPWLKAVRSAAKNNDATHKETQRGGRDADS